MIKQILMKRLAFFSLLCPSAVSATERPNIIYIFTDQQTASAMSCTGNPDLRTPNLDRLAAAGIMFKNAYCTAPLSGPSRSSMFTGYYPGAVGLSVNGAPMPDSLEAQTLGTLVKNTGYECAYGGKWHLPLLDIPDKLYGFENIYRHCDDGLAEACVEYLAREHKKPFFLVASYDNPHNICEYARSQNLPYGNIDIPDIRDCPGLPANFAKNPYDADVIENERSNNYKVYPTANFTPEDWRMYRYNYYRLVEKVDKEIGKIIDAIDKYNLWKNTVVIFSSDHGDGTGAHHWNQKSALYEEVVNIPLIVTLPGKKNAGKTLPQLISNGVDFFVSVCDWTGAKRPEGTAGISFRRIAEEGNYQNPHQEYVITETQFDGSKTRGWAVRSERYKYVLYDKGRYREQLFDMQKDRGEMRNLVMENAYDKELQKHRDILEKWMRMYNIRPTRPILHDVPGKRL
ncbi:choline-sulfatase/glucosamine-6-phosphate deaminase [Bacteroides zoogleoformans]|nr:choline-sulfatase/glucosamine-6-phosphate deaminase [Bacteroides zoogleoformans]